MFGVLQNRNAALIGCAIVLTCGGCAGSAGVRAGVVYDDPVMYVDTVPGYVYSRPPVYYRGYPAYWVDDRWYYQSSGGWVVFQREPAALYRHRVRYQPRVRVHAPPRVRVHSESQGRVRVQSQPQGRVRVQPPPQQGRVRSQGRVQGRVRVQGSAGERPRRDHKERR